MSRGEVARYLLYRPDIVRQRAQYAATVAGVAAAAITAGALANLGRLNDTVTNLLASSIGCWILSLGAWVFAIGGALAPINVKALSVQELTTLAAARAKKARQRTAAALLLTAIAVGVTCVAVAWAAVDSEKDDERVPTKLWLTAEGARTVAKLCGSEHEYRKIFATVAAIDLPKPAVPIEIDGRTVTLPTGSVLGAVTLNTPSGGRPDCK